MSDINLSNQSEIRVKLEADIKKLLEDVERMLKPSAPKEEEPIIIEKTVEDIDTVVVEQSPVEQSPVEQKKMTISLFGSNGELKRKMVVVNDQNEHSIQIADFNGVNLGKILVKVE